MMYFGIINDQTRKSSRLDSTFWKIVIYK